MVCSYSYSDTKYHGLANGWQSGLELTATSKGRFAYYNVTSPDGYILKIYLQLLAQFPNLENLQLPSFDELDLGFDGAQWQGRGYGRSVTQEGAETTELAANMTMGILPHLKSLSIGPRHANLTINDVGQPDVTWPWTRVPVEVIYRMVIYLTWLDSQPDRTHARTVLPTLPTSANLSTHLGQKNQ
ncbi:hypothetical protein F5883DRAFT_585822 [Diaporthe sp. PMI_573]|nr:hypothetical protein F5883DRAFT_585822 [Diaporthaceae sp. PMI_573]